MANPRGRPRKPRNTATVTPEAYHNFMGIAAEHKGKLDDARMKNATHWKETDNLNIHAGVAKVMLKLRRMDDAKRNDFLRAFDIYREYENFDETDMIDSAEEAARAEAQARENEQVRQEDIQDRQDTQVDKALANAAKNEESDTVGVSEEDPRVEAVIASQDLDAATRMGFEDCETGAHGTRDNPFPETESDFYDSWREGWEKAFTAGKRGTKEKAAA